LSNDFIERCEEIGTDLLATTGAEPTLAAERSLGYGGHGLLVVLPMNTPAQTVTLLWQSGTAMGAPWQALYPRRRKT
jgi:hypothetical protein